MEDLGNKIRVKRRDKKLTQQAVADALGISRVSVAQWELGQTKPTVDNLTALAGILGTNLDYFSVHSSDNNVGNGIMPNVSDLSFANIDISAMQSLSKDVPVLETAACSHIEGAFRLGSDAIDYVRRPPGLLAAKDVYALYMEGDSMEPKFMAGDLVFIHPGRPARINDAVVVQFVKSSGDYQQAMIGMLHKRNAEFVELQKYNPPAFIKIDAKTIQEMHRITTINELYGI